VTGIERPVVELHAGSRVTITHGAHAMEIAPAAGGRITRFSTTLDNGRVHDWLVPIVVQGWPGDTWPKGGCYPLVPFSNRVRDARFTAPDGTHVALSAFRGAAHALHGFGQYAPWTITQRRANEILLHYAHRAGDDGWPWAFEATQTFTLNDSGARLAMRVVNRSARPMPLGFGFHPYFGAQSAELDTQVLWRHEEEVAIEPAPGVPARHHEREEAGYTRYLGGWNGHATLQYSDDGPTLALNASGALSHAVVHCPAGAGYLCVEPVSHVSDGFNLHSKGLPGTGVAFIDPGSETEAWLALETGVHPDAPGDGAAA
jgi:aldose 1-epimerase